MDFERITEAEAKAMIVAERKVKIRRFRALMVLVIMGSLYAFVGLAGIMSRDMYALLMQPKIVWIFIVMPVAVVVWGFWPRATVTVMGKNETALPQNFVSTKKRKNIHRSNIVVDTITLWMIGIIFHSLLFFGGHEFLENWLYSQISPGIFHDIVKWVMDLIGFILVLGSIYLTIDTTTIERNHKAEIRYFNYPMFDNIPPGIVCTGLPTWLIATIKPVNMEVKNVVIGQFKDKRVPFILECDDFKVRVDAAIIFRVMDTYRYLQLEDGKAEPVLVQIANAKLFELINGPLVENGVSQTGIDGKPLKRYPTIESLKANSREIMDRLFAADDDQSIRNQYAEHGIEFIRLPIKDFENDDPAIIEARQRLAAKSFLEQAEMLDLKNALDKTEALFNIMTVGGFAVDRAWCWNQIQIKEGNVQSIILNPGNPSTNTGSSGKKGKGNNGGNGGGGPNTTAFLLPPLHPQQPPNS